MGNLPSEIKMTNHARERIEERNKIHNYYNTKNLMKSSCKWYNKDDLIHNCALYKHCCYTTRKSSQIGYITDGYIEVIYNKKTKTAITVLEVKEKFMPITKYIKPEVLEKIERKREYKELRKNMKLENNLHSNNKKDLVFAINYQLFIDDFMKDFSKKLSKYSEEKVLSKLA